MTPPQCHNRNTIPQAIPRNKSISRRNLTSSFIPCFLGVVLLEATYSVSSSEEVALVGPVVDLEPAEPLEWLVVSLKL